MFLGKALYSQSASSHPGVYTGTGEFNAGVTLQMDQHPIQSGLAKLLVASCYRNVNKPWLNGPLGLYADLTLDVPGDLHPHRHTREGREGTR